MHGYITFDSAIISPNFTFSLVTFKAFDADGNGSMSREELFKFLKLTIIQGAQVVDALVGVGEQIMEHKDEIVARFEDTIAVLPRCDCLYPATMPSLQADSGSQRNPPSPKGNR